MKIKALQVVRGSGNVFADFGFPNAAALQLKALLAAHIIATLDAKQMSTRGAAECTGYSAGVYARIRRAKLQRLTIEALLAILERLHQNVTVQIKVRPLRRTRQG